MKVATFSLGADVHQSARWKQAAEAEGFPSVGAWAAQALDAYLKARARAGLPIPLSWHRRRFSITLDDGKTVSVAGHVSPPFGSFEGTEEGPAAYAGRRRHVLVNIRTGEIIATLRSFAQCKALAAGDRPGPNPWRSGRHRRTASPRGGVTHRAGPSRSRPYLSGIISG